ncbi:hypothetical protein QRO11_21255 [Paracidovorax citrulli]|nr:hypothetical protein [Paracidovorax citrulli]UEG45985.1 hypothetical protein LKW27_20430 [Paracidovorax citrulli]WIY34441.1 hypothetical protein QRO11_21255 [Paracidovorax citrulli]
MAQQIKSIMKPDSFTVRTPSGTPQCQVGTVLSAGGTCYVRITAPS